MDISIIIPMHNAEKTIRKCVQSILGSDFNMGYEIIAVDDGSTDGSVEKIKDLIKGLKVRLIRQSNKGASAARNNGARKAKSELLIFVDSDVEFYKGTLKNIYDQLKREDVDFLTPRYSKVPLNKKWINKYKALADHCYYYRFIFSKDELKRPIRQVSLGGGVDCIKKRVFKKIGGYDESIKGAGVEKEILYIELFKNYKVIADPTIETRHNFPDFKPLVKNYFYRTIESIELMHDKGYKAQNLKHNTTRIFIGFLVPVSLVASIFLYFILKSTLPILFFLILFITYFWLHLDMYIIAMKDNGALFMLYSLMMNLFFCSLISFAGLIGTAKVVLKK